MNNELFRIKIHLDQLIKHNQNLEKNMEELLRNAQANETNKVFDGWVFIDEVMKILGVSRSTVYRFIKKDRLPFSKLGGRLIFKTDDMLEIINRNYKRFDKSDLDIENDNETNDINDASII